MPASELTGRCRTLRKKAEIALSTPFDRIFRLDTGRLLLTTCDASGTEVLIRRVAPGEFFGEFCFCSERAKPHDYVSARALEPSQFTEIQAGAFLRLINRSPVALQSFIGSVCRHLADADRRIFALAHRGAEERVCLLLQELSTQTALDKSTSPHITASHSEIANLAAMSRPHVSVILGRLRKRGLINYRRQGPIAIHSARIRRFLDQLHGG